MAMKLMKWERPPGWSWPKWRGWRVVMDNLLLPSGALLPRGYGVAWREPHLDCTVVMPIPLNIIVAWARLVWHRLKAGVRPSVIVDAYNCGRTAGSADRTRAMGDREEWIRRTAYEDGKMEGIQGLAKQLVADMDQSAVD